MASPTQKWQGCGEEDTGESRGHGTQSSWQLLSAPLSGLRGVGPGCNTREIADKLIELKAEIEELQQREQELDKHKVWVQQSIRNVTEDVQNS